uniref:G_PROTEIN_RECEP_F1_2 domain-containing protein n=1 Tax=Heterorhabditis bacteriophora TaxID=37862 RepID=A0A1I7W9K0_HETBA
MTRYTIRDEAFLYTVPPLHSFLVLITLFVTNITYHINTSVLEFLYKLLLPNRERDTELYNNIYYIINIVSINDSSIVFAVCGLLHVPLLVYHRGNYRRPPRHCIV